MSLTAKLLSASGGVDPLWVDSLFSAYTYTGNGSTQTITNGIDLAGSGGMVWIKDRSAAGSGHQLYDTTNGIQKYLISSAQSALSGAIGSLQTFTSSGFSINNDTSLNATSQTYASWTFRKAPKFFDVVTYTGDGVAGRQIPHALGIAPGMVVVKQTSAAGQSWAVYHRSLGGTYVTWLDLTSASTLRGFSWNNTNPTDVIFTVGEGGETNASGKTYVAYLFAHDTAADGIIQCGSFTTDGSGNATVNLGWEPQYVLKRSTAVDNWAIRDSSRGMPAAPATNGADLFPHNSNVESAAQASGCITPTATGFNVSASMGSSTYVYLAIRRPNKPPTLGTQVYNAIARAGTALAATVTGVGFAPDMSIVKSRSSGQTLSPQWYDRLRGLPKMIDSGSTAAELSATNAITSFDMGGMTVHDPSGYGVNSNGIPYINHFFKRAPGVFDIVCWTGAFPSQVTVNHSLGVAPEIIIAKARSTAGYNWRTYAAPIVLGNTLVLNSTAGSAANTSFVSVSSSSFVVGNSGDVDNNGTTYVAYLFATKAGISKVGSYTGNGSSQTINCGFTTGARFVLIKRTDSTGDWYVWDTVRGLVSGDDKHLSLNTTAAEVTNDDSIDPADSGFAVNQVAATNINVTSATYIFLAFA